MPRLLRRNVSSRQAARRVAMHQVESDLHAKSKGQGRKVPSFGVGVLLECGGIFVLEDEDQG